MSISRLEQETIINFNEAEPTAGIYTHNGALMRKLARLAQERPAEVRHTRSFPNGGQEYTVPKKWVKVNASRILSEEQRTAMAERMKGNATPKLAQNSA